MNAGIKSRHLHGIYLHAHETWPSIQTSAPWPSPLASQLSLQHTRHSLTSGPLHLLFPLPGTCSEDSCETKCLSFRTQLEHKLLLGFRLTSAEIPIPLHHHPSRSISFPCSTLFRAAITFRNHPFRGPAVLIYFPLPALNSRVGACLH